MKKAAIFFDLGWTLEDETASQVDRAKKVELFCSQCGIKVSAQDLLNLQHKAGKSGIGPVYGHALKQLGLTAEQMVKLKLFAKWDTRFLHLYPDAIDLLQFLHSRFILGIIANQSAPISERLKRYGIDKYLRHVLCSCEIGMDKPDENIFRLAERRIAGACNEFWMIGDRADNDIAPAKKIGWKTIRIMQGDHMNYRPEKAAEIADHEFRDLAEVKKVFSD
jgi:HAD superfamily hydrolase (TIGR01509 family)